MRTREFRGLQPLELDQLWDARPDEGGQLIAEIEDERHLLLSYDLHRLTTRAAGLQQPSEMKQIYEATVDGKRLPADNRYTPNMVALENMVRLYEDKPVDKDLVKFAEGFAALTEQHRARQYQANLRHLNRFVRSRGGIYIGFGSRRAFHVGQLDQLGSEERGIEGRHFPVSVLRGRDGKRGLEPATVDPHKTLYVSLRKLD